eukprot:TRINITY_DN650_c0_g1_i4.p1 TRINITY_DN650_c0_g1~~TRINITY_DN650_c0_g1_i4.p1  ORF type:complete len:2027 (+),score=565.48 TRINITY_DN650_c0_g1_i4:223-6081(+)
MPVGPMGQAQGMSLEGGQMLMMNTDIDSASSAVMNMLNDFSTPLSTTQLNLSDFQPQAVVQDLSYLTKSMHSCVYEMLNGLQNVEITSINSQASQISYNVAAMMQRAKVLGGLEGDNSLLAGAKGMSEAISQLLMCSKVAMENPGDAAAMDRLNAAAHNFEVASCFMNAACSGMLVDDAASQLYFESARAVACSLEDMLFECKNIEIVPAAQKMQVEYVSKSLMSTASLLSRAMTEPACQAQLQQIQQTAFQTAQSFLMSARGAGVDASILSRLSAAATKVGEGINLLVNTQRCANPAVIDSITNIREEMEQMKKSITLLSGSAGNGLQMQSYTTSTIDLTNKLLMSARTAVQLTHNPEQARQMTAQIEYLSNQATLFSTLSKAAIDNPRDASSFSKLLEAAKGLVNASQQMLSTTAIPPPNHYDILKTSCKSSCAVLTSLVTASKTAMRYVADPTARQAVLTEALQTEGAINRVVNGLIQSASDPNNPQLNNALFNAARELSRPCARLIEVSTKALPLVNDENQKQDLKNSSTTSQKTLQDLITACKGVQEASGGGAIEEALQKIQINTAELDSSIVEVTSGVPLPAIPGGADREGALSMVENAVRNLAAGIKKVTEASVKSGAELAVAVQSASSGIGEIVFSSKQLSSSVTPDLKSQSAILGAAKQVVIDSVSVIEAARNLSSNPSDPNLGAQLRNACGAIGQSINKIIPTCRAAGSGNQECDAAAQTIIKESEKLTSQAIVTNDKTFPQVAVLISTMSKGLTSAVTQLTAISKQATRDNLPTVVNSIASNMPHIINASSAAATLSPTASGKVEIVEAAKRVAQSTAKIIAAAKTANTPAGEKNVDEALQQYNTSITALLNSLDAATPGQQDLNDSMTMITTALSSFTMTGSTATMSSMTPQRATMSGSTGGNMKDLLNAAKTLADSVGKIVATTRTSPENAGPLMKQAAASVSAIFASFDTNLAANSQLSATAKNVAEATSKMVEVLKQVVSNPKERNNQTLLASVAQSTGDAIKQLMAAAKMSAPGQKECEEAMEKVRATIEDLDSASINVTVGLMDLLLEEPSTKSSQQLQLEIASSAKSIANNLTQLLSVTPSEYGPLVAQLSTLIPAMALSTKQLVCATTDPTAQQEHIAKSKAIADSVCNVIQSLKQFSAEPEVQSHKQSAAAAAREAQSAISVLVAAHSSSLGVIQECDDSINAVVSTAASLKASKPLAKTNKSYQQCQDDLSTCSKTLASTISNLVRASRTEADKLGAASKDVANVLPKIVEASMIAMSTINNETTQKGLREAVDRVVASVQNLLQSAKTVVIDPKSSKSQNAVSAGFKDVTDSITKLIASLKEGAVGYKQCDTAVEQVVSVIADLDAAALFAASGQMDVQVGAGVTLEDSQSKLKKSSELLLSTSKQLAAAVNSLSQDELGKNALKISEALSSLAKESKASAALLSDVVSQQEILSSAKTVLEVSQQLIISGKEAQAHPDDNSTKEMFRRTTQLVDGTVQQLMDTLDKAAADVILGIKELEKAKVEITGTTAAALKGQGAATQGATAEDVVKSLRAVAGSAAALVAAGNSTELIEAAKEAATLNKQLVANIRGAQGLGDQKTAAELLGALKTTSDATCNLLESLKTQRRDDVENQKKISGLSTSVADAVNGVLNAARKLPGGKNLELEDNDLEKIAEKELLAAMEAIEKAAKRLAPKREKKEGEVRLREEDLAEGITDAAREITTTAKNLIQAATAVQKEIQAKGRESKTVSPYKKDPAWAQGLISAAKAVAGTTEDLVIASNEAIKKTVGEEVIIAATRGVAGATARLVAASRAKADLNSTAQQRLTEVAKQVAEATAHLGAAARANFAPAHVEEASSSEQDDSFAKSRIAELEQQARIAQLELQLEKARGQLATNRKQEYGGAGAGGASPATAATAAGGRPLPAPGKASPKVAGLGTSGGVAQRLWGKK